MKNKLIYYSVGPLLYCPANQKNIAHSLISGKFGSNFSLALCLEDTINDHFLTEAEALLAESVQAVYGALQSQNFSLPKIFIRVRDPGQIARIFRKIGDAEELISGIIIPKFSLENVDVYLNAMDHLGGMLNKNKYIMPIYESSSIIDKRIRIDDLYRLKEKLDFVEEQVLNLRVGGNDLCHLFAFRRNIDESIHQIRPISDIFSDIISVYGRDYIISGPVWEYYSGAGWDSGLRKEIKDDKLCGFTGKTVIHPNQIAVVNEAYKVSRQNYDDAIAILNWDKGNEKLVQGNVNHSRMNEYKTHYSWALKTQFLAKHYGISDSL